MLVLAQKMLYKNWGGDRLREYGAKENCQQAAILYSVGATDVYDCEIIAGDYRGMRLSEAFRCHRERFGYDRYGSIFPLMVDIVNAQKDDLSVQIHPTDEYAQTHLHMPFGKAEAWYFILPPETNQVYCALKSQDQQEILGAIQDERYKDILRKIDTPKGSYLSIPAGVVHALTKGALIYEVQQAHDVLYRFWDHDRLFDGKKRPLETKESLENLRAEILPETQNFELNETKQESFVNLQRTELKGEFVNTEPTFALLTLLKGEIKTQDQTTITKGTSFLLFPGEKTQFTGKAEAMVAWPK